MRDIFKNFKKALLVALAFVILFGGVAYAATWEFKFPTIITDTSGSTRANLGVVMGFDGQDQIDAGYIAASGLDTNMQITSTDLKYMLSTGDCTAVIPNLPSYGKQTLSFYTGYVPNQTNFPIVQANDGFTTVSDDATLEWGTEGGIEIDGYINTDAVGGKYILEKQLCNTGENTIQVYVDPATDGTITGDIYEYPVTTETLAPDGGGSSTQITFLVGAATHWQANLTDDGNVSHVEEINVAWQRDSYSCDDASGASGEITNVTVYMVIKDTGSAIPNKNQAKTSLRTHGGYFDGAVIDGPLAYTTYSTSYNNNPSTTDPWTWAEVNDMEIGVSLIRPLNFAIRCTQVYARVTYNLPTLVATVSATSQSSGDVVLNAALGERPSAYDAETLDTIGVSFGAGLLPCIILEEIELSAPAASMTFSDIGDKVDNIDDILGVTSRHLVVMVNVASDFAANSVGCLVRINGDATAVYNYQELRASGAASVATRTTGGTSYRAFTITGANIANAYGGGTILIPAAFLTSNHKVMLSYGGSVEDYVYAVAGRYANSSAVDSITVLPSSGDFVAGSTIQLAVVDERYLVEEDYDAGADFLPVFDGIAGTGDDLAVVVYCRGDTAAVFDAIKHEINNDNVAANYWRQRVYGQAAVTTAQQVNDNWIMTSSADTAAANIFGAGIVFYSEYAEVANDPSYLSISGMHENGWASYIMAFSGRRNNVAAITKLEYFPAAGANFKAGSLFSLYRVPQYLIDRQELAAPAASITIDLSGHQGYEAVQLNIYSRTDVAAVPDAITFTINADAVAANYDTQYVDGSGAVVSAARNAANQDWVNTTGNTEGANEFGEAIVTFPQYSANDRHKHAIIINGRTENQVTLWSCRWENTNPITQIVLTPSAGANFVAGTIVEAVGLMPFNTFHIDIDGEVRGICDGNGVDVPNSAYDWVLFQNNVMPYVDYYRHSVGGALVTRYEPDTMLINTGEEGTADAGTQTTLDDNILTQGDDYWIGARLHILTTTDSMAPEGETSVVTDFDAANDRLTFDTLTAVVDAGDTYKIDFATIPDREVAANDARLTWGYNENMTIVYGEMESSESSEAGADAVGGFDMPAVALPVGWFASGGGVATLPFYDSFSAVASDIGQPVQTIYFLAIIGFAIGVFMILVTFARSALLGVIGFNLVLVVGASMTVVPLWIPFAIVIAQVAIMYLYKQVAY